MAPKFGTSGLRGLVSELGDDLCAAYVRAFLSTTAHKGTVVIGRDLRRSSPRIARAATAGAHGLGLSVIDAGAVPTPALFLAASARAAPSVMVTGSHIPDDRNGLKFYTAGGEITKADEGAILAALNLSGPLGGKEADDAEDMASFAYLRRYLGFLGAGALTGLRIGLYEHSSVARDLLAELLESLGARVVPLGRAANFVPVDTEAVSAETRRMLAAWAKDEKVDAIVSTDGDADRPLVADADGRVVPGDILGTLTAAALGAGTVITPVSSNTATERSGLFTRTGRTRIGSPYVIAAMEKAMADPAARVAGFEANGGFLLGFTATGPAGPLPALMTRDAFAPILVPLAEARRRGLSLAALVAELPSRFTASDRLQEVPTDRSQAFVARLSEDAAARAGFFADRGPEASVDRTDGLRVTFADGVVLHLRPSGNAPELRCYAEAATEPAATDLVAATLARASRTLAPDT